MKMTTILSILFAGLLSLSCGPEEDTKTKENRTSTSTESVEKESRTIAAKEDGFDLGARGNPKDIIHVGEDTASGVFICKRVIDFFKNTGPQHLNSAPIARLTFQRADFNNLGCFKQGYSEWLDFQKDRLNAARSKVVEDLSNF